MLQGVSDVSTAAGEPGGVARTRAADHATASVPRFGPGVRAADARRALVGGTFESAVEVVVCEQDAPVGLVPIERLLAADSDTPLGDLAEPAPAVEEDADDEVAAAQSARAGGRSVVVVAPDGRFLGLIPPRRVVTVVFNEHEEDLARLGGYLSRASIAVSATDEPVSRRLWHRLPWLLLGLAGAMATAGIVSSFEDELQTQVLLAFFVPAVVYMADAVGTQTETVVIRGMSVGVPIGRVFSREIATGVIVGGLLAALFLPFALLVWGDLPVAAAVSLALLASASIATIVAMALPYVLSHLGLDPAFGSGPLATVIQDLLSIAVYFGVAIAIAG